MRLGVCIIIDQYLFVGAYGLVKLIEPAEMIRAVKQVNALFIRYFRQGSDTPAIVACGVSLILTHVDISAAHFTL